MISGGPLASNPPALQTLGLSVHFDDRSAIDNINLEVRPGERVSLVGPNGAGKSTLLKAIAGIVPPSHGEILINGRSTTGHQVDVIYVPQRSGVDWSFPSSVLDVVIMARRTMKSRLLPYGDADRTAALDALRAVELDNQASVQIGKLSGGQQQRMFLARALLQQGSIYLLDEPFTGVDLPTQQLVTSLFQELVDSGKTVVFATHDLDRAETSSDRVIMLNRQLIASGPPAEVMNEQSLRKTFGRSFGVGQSRSEDSVV